MRINHNLSAQNTHRQYTINNNNQSKSLEKLSSGQRINKAADDAAGLAISEKMRGQIRGLEQAERNAQDGISLIQTAEGALNETHSILQRVRELSVQSANDTNTATDRAELQKEVDQLSQEISRIGNNTEFNTQNLLSGDYEGSFQIGANEGQNLSVSIGDMRGFSLGVAGDAKVGITATRGDGADTTQDLADGTYSVSFNGTSYEMKDTTGSIVGTSADGKTWDVTDDDTLVFTDAVKDGSVKVAGTSVTATATVTNTGLEAGEYSIDYVSGTEAYIKDSNGTVIATSVDADVFKSVEDSSTVLDLGAALTADTTLKVGGIDISTKGSIDSAITKIDSAIQSVSAERSKLGAFQNRLEHTINNLGASSENLTAAESRIRDVDMAKEYSEYSKHNILSQASTSMLAQANQQTQGVLQLLR